MADEALLRGLDPFSLLDEESDRVHRLFLSSPDWSRPSRCDGWSVRDMLGHLMALEDYARAGLSGEVAELLRQASSAAALDVAAFNDWGIGQYAEVPIEDLIDRWREANLLNRAELRARGRDGSIDSSIGPYPSWLQTFHFAVEYATHGDDVYVVVPDEERSARTAWRVQFGRFVLEELDKPVRVELASAGRIRVAGAGMTAELSDEEFVEATQGRLPAEVALDGDLRALLATI